jgi:hypothetical protein
LRKATTQNIREGTNHAGTVITIHEVNAVTRRQQIQKLLAIKSVWMVGREMLTTMALNIVFNKSRTQKIDRLRDLKSRTFEILRPGGPTARMIQNASPWQLCA